MNFICFIYLLPLTYSKEIIPLKDINETSEQLASGLFTF